MTLNEQLHKSATHKPGNDPACPVCTVRMPRTMDYRTAFAAAWDHGNRHAHTHGRTVWAEEDYDAACAELERLLAIIPKGAN